MTRLDEILARLGVSVDAFVMVGNSMASDIEPILEIGGTAVHVPSYPGWHRDHAEVDEASDRFFRIDSLAGLPFLLEQLGG